jgi:hypothetical protein
MFPAPTYESVVAELDRAFKQRYAVTLGTTGMQVRMVGLVFAPPWTPVARNEILPAIVHMHERSGNHIDFFWAGYDDTRLMHWVDTDGKAEIRQNFPNLIKRDPESMFRESEFNYFRRQLEEVTQSKWRHSGGTELLLLNAVYQNVLGGTTLDFGSSLQINLEEAVKDGAIASASQLLEKIFTYAETQSGDDPTWGFAKQQQASIHKSALLEMVLSLLPVQLMPLFRQGRHFLPLNLA